MRRNSWFGRHLVVSAALVAFLACGGGDLTLPGDAGSPADLHMVSGDEQSARTGEELPEPLVVRLVDERGNGLPSRMVSWAVGDGGGSVSPAAVETDTAGLASAWLTLGPTPGANTASAVVSGLDAVTFTASATGGPGGGDDELGPDRLVFQVQPSDAVEDERIKPPVAVAVVDRNGQVVRDFKLRIELALASGSGRLEGRRERDTKGGVATFDDLRVTEEGDGKVLRASAPEGPFLGAVESEPFRVEDD